MCHEKKKTVLDQISRQILGDQYARDEKRLRATCRSLCHMRGYYDAEETESEALVHYVEAAVKYDPAKGELSAWCFRRTRLQLLEAARSHARRGAALPRTWDYDVDQTPGHLPGGVWDRVRGDLGPDGTAVLLGVLHGELGDTLDAVVGALDCLGWAPDRVRAAVEEVRDVLGRAGKDS